MSVIIDALRRARALAWSDLVPAFDHAIILAEEAEALADHAANEAQASTTPAYPPIVLKLAGSVRPDPKHHVRQEVPWPEHPGATRNTTRFRCDCGWLGSTFPDDRDCTLERETARQEASNHMKEVGW